MRRGRRPDLSTNTTPIAAAGTCKTKQLMFSMPFQTSLCEVWPLLAGTDHLLHLFLLDSSCCPRSVCKFLLHNQCPFCLLVGFFFLFFVRSEENEIQIVKFHFSFIFYFIQKSFFFFEKKEYFLGMITPLLCY